MELINTQFLTKSLRLESTLSGWQQLYWDGQLVSERAASAESEGHIEHHFTLQSEEGQLQCSLVMQLQWQPFSFEYQLLVNDELVQGGLCTADDLEHHAPQTIVPEKKSFSFMGFGLLALKLLKSVKVIKAALVGASVAAYSWMFSLPFALSLIACLVFHEYGHLRAMKYFGMKTKGIFLIPFVGGLAVGEDTVNTRWQDVVISIMGPTFGLFLSVLFLVLYWLTDEIFFAGLASFNAILNLFNLLPILPLDGGHILKSVTFSMHSKVGIVMCVLGAVLGVGLSYYFGLALLGFMLAIGMLDILFEWRNRHHSRLLPLDRYGQVFSTAWYVATVASFAAIVLYLANSDHPVLGLPKLILQS